MERHTLNSERWQQVESLFQSALARAPEERTALLDNACNGDEALRQEVESLLASLDKTDDFIEKSAFDAGMKLFATGDANPLIGGRIGPYKITGEIGRGGTGVVYLALRDDEQYQKQVAIKLVKRGMDTDAVIRRFRNERQILAQLEHPNIARLIDGGTTEDGVPYFVMEYVGGVPLDEYCDSHNFSTDERLKLFRTACSAVQFAHQNLVIHRDIKPSNILVTEDGTPKLLDFGIAKLLHPDLGTQTAELTATALRVMTPEYASPEQIRGETITTTSDVYSLGVVLYELLTGQRPYQIKTKEPYEIARVICEQEPVKPSIASSVGSSLRHRLGGKARTQTKAYTTPRGDLDNIILMATRKEAARRYQSVAQFSEDIRRYLEGLPVIAQGEVNDAHAATANLSGDLVRTDSAADKGIGVASRK